MLPAQFGNGPALALAPPLTGLKVWLRSDVGVTVVSSKVSAWADQSGNGNSPSQSDPAKRMDYTASSINGKPAATGAVDCLLNFATSPLSTGSDRTVVAVLLPKAGAGTFSPGGVFCAFKSGTVGHQWVGYLATIGGTTFGWSDNAVDNNIASPPTILNTPSVLEIYTSVGQLPSFFVNGTSKSPGEATVITTDDGTDGFFVGNNGVAGSGGQFFTGDMCALYVYDHLLNSAEKLQLRTYLQSFYAIPLGAP